MASDPGDLNNDRQEDRRTVENRLLASFIEILSADAAVVIYSWTGEAQKTRGRVASWGNTFTTKAMIEWAYDEVIGTEDESIDEDQDGDNE